MRSRIEDAGSAAGEIPERNISAPEMIPERNIRSRIRGVEPGGGDPRAEYPFQKVVIPLRKHPLEQVFRSGITPACPASFILERIFRSGITSAGQASYILERIFRSRASEGRENPTQGPRKLRPQSHEKLDPQPRKPASKGCSCLSATIFSRFCAPAPICKSLHAESSCDVHPWP